ncbi:hypothetical protein D9M69_491590 [compost metagenome]
MPDADTGLGNEVAQQGFIRQYSFQGWATRHHFGHQVPTKPLRPIQQARQHCGDQPVAYAEHGDLANLFAVARRKRLRGNLAHLRARLDSRHATESVHQAVHVTLVRQQVELHAGSGLPVTRGEGYLSRCRIGLIHIHQHGANSLAHRVPRSLGNRSYEHVPRRCSAHA